MKKEEFDAIASMLTRARSLAGQAAGEIRDIRKVLLDQIEDCYVWQIIYFGQAELEQPPFDGKDYLIRGEASCVVASWKYGCFAFNTGDGVLFLDRGRLTHWMPVPQFIKG